jgi:hypothetical protein
LATHRGFGLSFIVAVAGLTIVGGVAFAVTVTGTNGDDR